MSHVSVDVSHDRVHAQDAGQDANGAGGQSLDHFTRVITLEGDLSEAQRDKLMQMADKCPGHRTLERSSHIITRRHTDEMAPQVTGAAAVLT